MPVPVSVTATTTLRCPSGGRCCGAYGHSAAGGRVVQCVIDKIGNHLADAVTVDCDLWQMRFQRTGQYDLIRLSLRAYVFHHFLYKFADICGLQFEFELAGIGNREQAQVINQPGQQQRFFMQRSNLRRRCEQHAIEHGFQIGLDDAEWGAQLVCNIGNQCASQPLIVFQRLGHLIECHRKLANFVE